MSYVVEVNEAKVSATTQGSAWWQMFRKRFDPVGRITDRNVSPVGGYASVACDSEGDARWLAEHMVDVGGLPSTAVRVRSAAPVADKPLATGGSVERTGPMLTAEEATPGVGWRLARDEEILAAAEAQAAWLDRPEEIEAEATREARIARRRHDPGALMEEPDLYEQGEGGTR